MRSLLTEWSPVAKHFLDGYLQRLEGIEATVRERERLISLGRLSAGLAHEVNNPAAAALRATADLRDNCPAIAGGCRLDRGGRSFVGTTPPVSRTCTQRAASAPALEARGAIDFANAEDEIGSWLDEHGVDNAWSLATTFTTAGLDTDFAGARREQSWGPATLNHSLNWIAAALGASNLLDQVEDAVGPHRETVGAVKEYSYMDRAPEQEVDVHDGIEKTLLVLGHKLRPGVEIVRDYDAHLPTDHGQRRRVEPGLDESHRRMPSTRLTDRVRS